jgi:hypothetical protein
MKFENIWNGIVTVMAIIFVAALLFGAFLIICEDVFGYTPHLYFTKYHK